jgi:hypothetical protein
LLIFQYSLRAQIVPIIKTKSDVIFESTMIQGKEERLLEKIIERDMVEQQKN